ncbi:nascent polypeptide-associated complex subunit alpha, muscle-specific form-like [Brienomyrus brachyistius]|uniref:nascent polypeptide-associated complex subunit alpha, muscle-specific form-like n=1 Tax=Brienomyrus brachyistius TaxID=42636 RepID=UPI0020B181E7|nr:nascent polypeptide-associated complex subunit alpha, muscle-specific form-like [Brienomyrus brachyistius]
MTDHQKKKRKQRKSKTPEESLCLGACSLVSQGLPSVIQEGELVPCSAQEPLSLGASSLARLWGSGEDEGEEPFLILDPKPFFPDHQPPFERYSFRPEHLDNWGGLYWRVIEDPATLVGPKAELLKAKLQRGFEEFSPASERVDLERLGADLQELLQLRRTPDPAPEQSPLPAIPSSPQSPPLPTQPHPLPPAAPEQALPPPADQAPEQAQPLPLLAQPPLLSAQLLQSRRFPCLWSLRLLIRTSLLSLWPQFPRRFPFTTSSPGLAPSAGSSAVAYGFPEGGASVTCGSSCSGAAEDVATCGGSPPLLAFAGVPACSLAPFPSAPSGSLLGPFLGPSFCLLGPSGVPSGSDLLAVCGRRRGALPNPRPEALFPRPSTALRAIFFPTGASGQLGRTLLEGDRGPGHSSGSQGGTTQSQTPEGLRGVLSRFGAGRPRTSRGGPAGATPAPEDSGPRTGAIASTGDSIIPAITSAAYAAASSAACCTRAGTSSTSGPGSRTGAAASAAGAAAFAVSAVAPEQALPLPVVPKTPDPDLTPIPLAPVPEEVPRDSIEAPPSTEEEELEWDPSGTLLTTPSPSPRRARPRLRVLMSVSHKGRGHRRRARVPPSLPPGSPSLACAGAQGAPAGPGPPARLSPAGSPSRPRRLASLPPPVPRRSPTGSPRAAPPSLADLPAPVRRRTSPPAAAPPLSLPSPGSLPAPSPPSPVLPPAPSLAPSSVPHSVSSAPLGSLPAPTSWPSAVPPAASRRPLGLPRAPLCSPAFSPFSPASFPPSFAPPFSVPAFPSPPSVFVPPVSAPPFPLHEIANRLPMFGGLKH